MRIFLLFSLLLFISCSNRKDQRIEVPNISDEFYHNALEEVALKYAEKPTNRLLRQKLYYYEQLNWPEEAIEDLNIFLEKNGLDRKIVDLFLQYYLSNDKYKDLIELLDKWEFYHGLDEDLAQYRVLSNYRANGEKGTSQLISDYLTKFKSEESLEFAIQLSESIGDSVAMENYCQDLFDINPDHALLLKSYVPYLIERGDFLLAYNMLTKSRRSAQFESNLLLARALYGMDSIDQSIALLKNYERREANLQISEWYREEKLYDSAIYHLDKIIVQDSSRDLLITKAEMLDERGWFNTSYSLFSFLIAQDSTDSIVVDKAAIVARKIAYLRNLKEAERQIAVPELKPKKITQ
ncbi:MAG: hypothetical protein ABJ004_15480 [Cyclobacteriaceae bacterium]